MRRFINRLTLSVLLTTLLVGISASSTLAKSPPTTFDESLFEDELQEYADGAPSGVNLVPWPSDPNSSELAAVNPYGCFGQTDDPHVSTHAAGQKINVVARSECDVVMKRLYVSTKLYKLHCSWGIICHYEEYGPLGKQAKNNVKKVKTDSAGGPCENGFYKGSSLHIATNYNDETVYYAFTSNGGYVSGC